MWVQVPNRVLARFESWPCGFESQTGFWPGLNPGHVGLSPKLGFGQVWVPVTCIQVPIWGQWFPYQNISGRKNTCANVLGQRRTQCLQGSEEPSTDQPVARIRGILWIRDFIPKVIGRFEECEGESSQFWITTIFWHLCDDQIGGEENRFKENSRDLLYLVSFLLNFLFLCLVLCCCC